MSNQYGDFTSSKTIFVVEGMAIFPHLITPIINQLNKKKTKGLLTIKLYSLF
jgi:hypothetical protein